MSVCLCICGFLLFKAKSCDILAYFYSVLKLINALVQENILVENLFEFYIYSFESFGFVI